jgi:hypothetical protein
MLDGPYLSETFCADSKALPTFICAPYCHQAEILIAASTSTYEAADGRFQRKLASLKYLSRSQKDRIIARTERSSHWVLYATDFAGFATYEFTDVVDSAITCYAPQTHIMTICNH